MSSEYKKILLDIDGPIATLTINMPESRNPISGQETVDEIVDACAKVKLNDDLSVLIITGAGTAFSAGGDIKAMRSRANDSFGGAPVNVQNFYRRGIQRIPLAIEDLDVPVIGAVNGAAIGAGCDLAMMCDIRIASEKAKFGETFVNLGLIPGDGGSWFLTRQIGYQKAAELTFTGKVVDAEEALSLGMVTRVVPAEKLMEEANALAQVIAEKPRRTLRLAKMLLKQSTRMNLKDFLDTCAQVQSVVHQTDDHKEALDAFFEKRPPNFTGK